MVNLPIYRKRKKATVYSGPCKPGEIWRTIPKYFRYQVSSLGRVRAAKRKSRQLFYTIKHPVRHKEAMVVYLYNTKGRRMLQVKNLVALLFLDPPPKHWRRLIHKNGDITDCSAINLEWSNESFYGAQLSPQLKADIKRELENNKDIYDLAEKYDVSISTLRNILKEIHASRS